VHQNELQWEVLDKPTEASDYGKHSFSFSRRNTSGPFALKLWLHLLVMANNLAQSGYLSGEYLGSCLCIKFSSVSFLLVLHSNGVTFVDNIDKKRRTPLKNGTPDYYFVTGNMR